MSDIRRFNIQGNRNRIFTIKKIDYIELEKAITNKALSNEIILLGDCKFIRLFYNPITNSKK